MEHNINIFEIIQAGANFLSSKASVIGCWPVKINLEKLDMSSPINDILGQLLENRYRAIFYLGLCQGENPIRPEFLGLTPSTLFSAEELTEVWKKIIPKIVKDLNL